MRRLTITLLLVVMVAIFGLGLALDALFERYNSAPVHQYAQLQSFADGLAISLNDTDDPNGLISRWPQASIYAIALEDNDELLLPRQLQTPFAAGQALLLETETEVSLHYFLSRHMKVLSIRTALQPDQKNQHIRVIFTGLFYFGTLLLVLLWLKPLLHRLNQLRQTARQFGAGELNSRMNTKGLSYIRDIEQDFNKMADKIQQLINDNKLLTSAVSHDLRTPLARLRFGIDTLADSDNPESRALYQHRINNDLNEMENLVNSLLRYARLDNVLAESENGPVSLRQLISECVSQYYDSRIIIRIDDSRLAENELLLVDGAIDHLATLFNNLIQNAIDHAKNRLVIELSLSDADMEVAFCDDGSGISEALRKQVLQPFQRGESNDKKSYGLGLAVVARICKHHRSSLTIDYCSTLGGARISVVFQKVR